MSINFERKLPTPQEVKDKFPLREEARQRKNEIDKQISDIFNGKSKKLVIIVGPSSADNRYSVLDYCQKLAKVSRDVKDELVLVPRIYTNKPLKGNDGYKGIVFKDDIGKKKIDAFKGILYPRALYLKVLMDTGLAPADELLHPAEYEYFDDLLSYVAVGARSVENQDQRLVASGIDVPVGMKNPKSGNIEVMMDAVECARKPHTFVYKGCQVSTDGNPHAHMILRGLIDRNNNQISNYSQDDLIKLYVNAKARGLKNPSLIVDVSHANSSTDPFEQPNICKAVMESAKKYSDVNGMLKGFMIESYLEDGRQKPDGTVYGKSITDACLGWEKTETLIYEIASAVHEK